MKRDYALDVLREALLRSCKLLVLVESIMKDGDDSHIKQYRQKAKMYRKQADHLKEGISLIITGRKLLNQKKQ